MKMNEPNPAIGRDYDIDARPTAEVNPDLVEESENADECFSLEDFWGECSDSYTQAFEKGELFDKNDDIKTVKTDSSFECFVSTRIGGRTENQDTAAFRSTDRGLLLIVCDGMGGGPSGKRASYMAAYAISKYVSHAPSDLSDAEIIENALQEAHYVLKFDTKKHPENYGMGTTAAVLLINEEHAVFGHVGDSRIYQIRGSRLLRRTIDHSLVARRMQLENWTDEEARTSADSNIITQAIGHNDIEPEIEIYPYLKGDRFLICSDGVWGHYPQNDLLKILKSSVPAGGALSDLMVTTDNMGINEGNKHDNFTAILLQTNITSKTKDAMTKTSRIVICILSALLLASVAFNIYQLSRAYKLQNAVQSEEMPDTADIHHHDVSQSLKPAEQVPYDLNVTENETVPATSPSEEKSDTLYVIKSGDLISKIAVKFHTTPDEIKLANPGIDLNKISIGQTIAIPLNRNMK